MSAGNAAEERVFAASSAVRFAAALRRSLADASWLTRRRVRDYSTILIIAYGAGLLWILGGEGLADPSGKVIGTDFLSFWTVSSALQHGAIEALYRPEILAALERQVAGAATVFYAWSYPPTALLVVYPLALLPYLWSLAAWLGGGLALYMTSLWRIIPRPLTIWAGLAFPAVFMTIGHGQNALLTAALFGWALLVAERRPVAAGMLIGLLSFKPQLGLVIPVALAAGGHWRLLASAATTALLLAGATCLLFGARIWADYWAYSDFARAVLDEGLVPFHKMESVFAASRLAGATVSTAYGVQAMVTLAAATAVAWVWRRPAAAGLKNAALVTASLLATPFLLDYDLTLLALPIAWLAVPALRSGLRPWEGTTLAASCLLPLVARFLAQHTGIVLAPLVEAALLAVILRRIRAERSGAYGLEAKAAPFPGAAAKSALV
jgi:alpha-1,2-mannosyltransferase